jgi:hypothetical protein
MVVVARSLPYCLALNTELAFTEGVFVVPEHHDFEI